MNTNELGCFCRLPCCSFTPFLSALQLASSFFWGGFKGFVEFVDFLVTGAKIILVVTRDLTSIFGASAKSLSPGRGQTIPHTSPPPLLLLKFLLALMRHSPDLSISGCGAQVGRHSFELLKEISPWISAQRLAVDLHRPELLFCSQKSSP